MNCNRVLKIQQSTLKGSGVCLWVSRSNITPTITIQYDEIKTKKYPSIRPTCHLWNWNVHRIYQETLHWRHNGRDSVSNHQSHDWLLNRLFRRRSKKTSKLRVTGLCVGNSPGTGEFRAQMASNAENISIWWRHHEYVILWSLVVSGPLSCTSPQQLWGNENQFGLLVWLITLDSINWNFQWSEYTGDRIVHPSVRIRVWNRNKNCNHYVTISSLIEFGYLLYSSL